MRFIEVLDLLVRAAVKSCSATTNSSKETKSLGTLEEIEISVTGVSISSLSGFYFYLFISITTSTGSGKCREFTICKLTQRGCFCHSSSARKRSYPQTSQTAPSGNKQSHTPYILQVSILQIVYTVQQ